MRLLYFASVRQQTGRSEEELPLPDGVETVGDLVRHLRARGGGYETALAGARLHAAVNRTHAGCDAAIGDGDEIAFFPPVTGG